FYDIGTSPSCLFYSYAFFFPIVDHFLAFLLKLIFDQSLDIILREMIKIVLLINVDEHSIVFDKWSKTSFSFSHFFVLIPSNRSICFFLQFNKLHCTIIIHIKDIFTRIQRDKSLTKTHIESESTDIYLNLFTFVFPNDSWKFKQRQGFFKGNGFNRLIRQ